VIMSKTTDKNKCIDPKKRKTVMKASMITLFGIIAAVFIVSPIDELLIVGIVGGTSGMIFGGIFLTYGSMVVLVSVLFIITILCHFIRKNNSKKNVVNRVH